MFATSSFLQDILFLPVYKNLFCKHPLFATICMGYCQQYAHIHTKNLLNQVSTISSSLHEAPVRSSELAIFLSEYLELCLQYLHLQQCLRTSCLL